MPRLGPQIDALGRGARIEDVPVVVVEAQPSLTKDQKPYARYLFRDRTGTVRGIRWEHTVEEGEAGAVALVSGSVDEYQGGLQLKVRDLVLVPQPTEELLSRLRAAVDSQLQQTLLAVARRAQAELPATFWQVFEIALGADPFDTSTPFWTWAAAQSKHHSEHGGLAWPKF